MSYSAISILMAALPCRYCSGSFSAPSEILLLHHIRLVHSLEPGFSIQCSSNGCSRTFKNFRTYQNHRRLKHRRIEEPSETPTYYDLESDQDIEGLSNGENEYSVPIPDTTDMQSFAVKWILKTRETRSLTRAATQGVIEDVQDLMDLITQSLWTQTQDALVSNGVQAGIISDVKDVFSSPVTKPFEGIMSFHQQLQYCRKNFNFVVRLWYNIRYT